MATSAALTLPTLPQELLDRFIDELDTVALEPGPHPRDKLTTDCLRTCLLVSRSFRHRALPKLYNHIFLYEKYENDLISTSDDLSLLLDVLAPRHEPRLEGIRALAPCVRALTILPMRREYVDPDAPQGLTGLITNSILPRILQVLHREQETGAGINYLNLSFSKSTTTVSWTNLPIPFRTGITILMTSQSLDTLQIRQMGIPGAIDIFLGGYLKHLTLEAIFREEHIHDATNYAFPSLESLHTDNSIRIGTGEGPSRQFLQNLKKLTLVNRGGDSEDVRRGLNALQRVTHCLQELRLEFQDSNSLSEFSFGLRSATNSFDIGALRNLTSFTLFDARWRPPFYDATAVDVRFEVIVEILDIRTPAAKLTDFSLEIFMLEVNVKEDFICVPDATSVGSQHWVKLDQILTSTKYPAMRRVLLDLRVEVLQMESRPNPVMAFSERDFRKSTTQALRQAFPLLAESDTIDLTINVHVKCVCNYFKAEERVKRRH